jgi:uncharacterized protein
VAAPLRIELEGRQSVSALLDEPASQAVAGLVLAHGAGAGMAHPFIASFAAGLAARGVAVLRYQFPFMEQGSKRPDAPAVAQATVRAAVAQAVRAWPGLAVFAGGKSFGGRVSAHGRSKALIPERAARRVVQ